MGRTIRDNRETGNEVQKKKKERELRTSARREDKLQGFLNKDGEL